MAEAVTTAMSRARERVLYRLRNPQAQTNGVCGFYHPEDQAALERLTTEGLAHSWRGEGRDAGLLLGRLNPPSLARPFAPAEQKGEG